jgi:hypothetical protein
MQKVLIVLATTLMVGMISYAFYDTLSKSSFDGNCYEVPNTGLIHLITMELDHSVRVVTFNDYTTYFNSTGGWTSKTRAKTWYRIDCKILDDIPVKYWKDKE